MQDMEMFFEKISKKTGLSIDAIKSMYENESEGMSEEKEIKSDNMGMGIANKIKKPEEKTTITISESDDDKGMGMGQDMIKEKLSEAGFDEMSIEKVIEALCNKD